MHASMDKKLKWTVFELCLPIWQIKLNDCIQNTTTVCNPRENSVWEKIQEFFLEERFFLTKIFLFKKVLFSGNKFCWKKFSWEKFLWKKFIWETFSLEKYFVGKNIFVREKFLLKKKFLSEKILSLKINSQIRDRKFRKVMKLTIIWPIKWLIKRVRWN